MNDNDFDLVTRAWLDDGPNRMPDRGLQSALEEIHATRQRRVVWPSWRAPRVSVFAGLASAAVIGFAVGLLALNVLPRQPDGPIVGGPVTPTQTPTPAQTVDPAPSASPSATAAQARGFPELTQTFVSPRNGFSVGYPEGATVMPANQLWAFGSDVDVVDTGFAAVLKGASALVDSVDLSGDWLDGALEDSVACRVPLADQAAFTIDGQPGRIVECPTQVAATIIVDRRVYLFTLTHERADARALFDALAATIDLTPDTAVNYPSLPSTFVSPVNGFSFGYLDRGGLDPATERWDPATEPPLEPSGVFNGRHDVGFDGVETGLGAYFKAASTDIPAGVAVDDWIDATLASRGSTPTCMLPRRQQEEILIDGLPARISEGCAHEFLATVVVDGRLDVFILLYGDENGDGRAYFDSWLATIDLHPAAR